MESLNPTTLLLTHFGAYADPQRHIAEIRERTIAWAAMVRAGLESGADEDLQRAALQAQADAELGGNMAAGLLYRNVASVDQCWQGLARYWRKKLDG
jgi:hypothetical protein